MYLVSSVSQQYLQSIYCVPGIVLSSRVTIKKVKESFLSRSSQSNGEYSMSCVQMSSVQDKLEIIKRGNQERLLVKGGILAGT